jgi:hypothetical protein
MTTEYTVGQQPCQNFHPEIEYNEYAQWENCHECPKCGKTRSFCPSCHRDHHEGGWETCSTGPAKEDVMQLVAVIETSRQIAPDYWRLEARTKIIQEDDSIKSLFEWADAIDKSTKNITIARSE